MNAYQAEGRPGMIVLQLAILLLAAAGHMTVWVMVVNRLHALAIPRWLITGLSGCCWAGLFLAPLALLAASPGGMVLDWSFHRAPWYVRFYGGLCVVVAIAALADRIQSARRQRRSRVLLAHARTAVDLVAALGHRPVARRAAQALASLPGNQVLELVVHQKTLALPRLDPALDGLRIAHLSDLHMSGRIGAAFFQEVVDQTNRLEPDLVAVTGDLFDHRRCVDWGADVLGRLDSPGGVYFVLGNHDLRVDARAARKRLVAKGLVDLGGRWLRIDIGGRPVILAGNELPWFVPAADMEHCPDQFGGRRPLRLLLAHTPDQIDWAQRFDFDLMLAGHTHGGQIRFPLLGSVVAPSRLGTRYAGGLYQFSPTVMHVSRGISSLTLLRWNCPPELALLVLRRAESDATGAAL